MKQSDFCDSIFSSVKATHSYKLLINYIRIHKKDETDFLSKFKRNKKGKYRTEQKKNLAKIKILQNVDRTLLLAYQH